MAKTYKYHFIYHIRILVGSKKNYFYVGMHSTNNIDDGYCGSGKRVSDIIDSYKKRGYKDNEIYERTILTFATSRKEVIELESIYVDKNILLNEFSLNDKTGGNQCIEFSAETCKKISKAAKGRKVSEETKKKISKGHKGKKLSKETKQKMSENNPMKNTLNREKISKALKGRTFSKETKQRMSKAAKKRMTNEARKHLSDLNKGKIVPEDVRQKISNTLKGRESYIRTEEIIQKMSEAHKGQKAWNKDLPKEQQPTYGKHFKCKPYTCKKRGSWYNNGVEQKQYFEGEQPDGWVRGMLKNTKISEKTKGLRFVNNGVECTKIHESKLDEFFATHPDWKLGYIKKSA